MTEGGSPRLEHRTLDLLAALEFGSLHGVLERMKPGGADKRVEALVRQALEQGWAFRVIQDQCRKEKERAMQAPPGRCPHPGRATKVRGAQRRLARSANHLLRALRGRW